MTWNHRVIRKSYTHPDGTVEYYYEIHEVYYDEEENIVSWTADKIAPQGDSVEDLQKEIKRMLEATNKPILDERKLETQYE